MGPSTGGGNATIPGGRMTHSLSTPSGVDGTPSTPHHRGGKKLAVRIQMLDDSVTMFQVQVSTIVKSIMTFRLDCFGYCLSRISYYRRQLKCFIIFLMIITKVWVFIWKTYPFDDFSMEIWWSNQEQLSGTLFCGWHFPLSGVKLEKVSRLIFLMDQLRALNEQSAGWV